MSEGLEGNTSGCASAERRGRIVLRSSARECYPLVMCDQLAPVDLTRLTERVDFLSIDEMQQVDDGLALVLDR